MSRRMGAAALAVGVAAFIACFLFAEDDPILEARQTFRRNLAAASSNWSAVELECPLPGCANHVKARWAEADGKYVFVGFRQPRSVGGGIVFVYAENIYDAGDGSELVSYVFMSDGSPTRVALQEGVKRDMRWAEPRAREFFDAAPPN